MRLARLVLLALPISLSACGDSSPSTTLSVTCNGSLALAGAQSIDIAPATGSSGTVLSFPDPVNAGHTGTLPVTVGQRCTIAPVRNKAS